MASSNKAGHCKLKTSNLFLKHGQHFPVSATEQKKKSSDFLSSSYFTTFYIGMPMPTFKVFSPVLESCNFFNFNNPTRVFFGLRSLCHEVNVYIIHLFDCFLQTVCILGCLSFFQLMKNRFKKLIQYVISEFFFPETALGNTVHVTY